MFQYSLKEGTKLKVEDNGDDGETFVSRSTNVGDPLMIGVKAKANYYGQNVVGDHPGIPRILYLFGIRRKIIGRLKFMLKLNIS